MTNQRPAPGYLAEIEASHISLEAMPGAVAVLLKRDIVGERAAGRRARRMMIELSLSEAVQHWQMLGDEIRKAGALAAQPGGIDAAPIL